MKDMVDLFEKSVLFMDAFIKMHGPTAWEATLKVYRLNAFQSIVATVITCLIFYAVLLKIWYSYHTEKQRCLKTEGFNDCDLTPYLCLAVIPSIIAVISTIVLFDVWMWVQLFKPELALTRDVLKKIVAIPNGG